MTLQRKYKENPYSSMTLTKEQKQYAQRVMNQGRGCYIMDGDVIYEVVRVKGQLIGVERKFDIGKVSDGAGVTITAGKE
jgi:hypothetical protein